MSLVVRATPEELDEIVALDRVCMGECHWTLDEANALWVVHDTDDRVCAYASARMLTNEADNGAVYLDRAGVAKEARGRGLQRRLIHARTAWARRRGARVAITYTVMTGCTSGNNLARAGFRLYRPAYAWAGRDVLYWQKAL